MSARESARGHRQRCDQPGRQRHRHQAPPPCRAAGKAQQRQRRRAKGGGSLDREQRAVRAASTGLTSVAVISRREAGPDRSSDAMPSTATSKITTVINQTTSAAPARASGGRRCAGDSRVAMARKTPVMATAVDHQRAVAPQPVRPRLAIDDQPGQAEADRLGGGERRARRRASGPAGWRRDHRLRVQQFRRAAFRREREGRRTRARPAARAAARSARATPPFARSPACRSRRTGRSPTLDTASARPAKTTANSCSQRDRTASSSS